MKNDDLRRGHRERLRKKFLASGLKALHDYEALELLLTFAIPRRDVKPIAKQLLKHFGDFTSIFDASQEELRKIGGLGENSIVLLALLRELCAEYLAGGMKRKDVVSSPEAAADFARMKLGGMKKETLMIIFLDAKNQVINYDLRTGTVDRANVYPRDVIQRCLEVHAVSFILAHNHPSGDCEPSPQDVAITKTLSNAAETVGIRLLDHMIVSKSSHVSLAQRKLF